MTRRDYVKLAAALAETRPDPIITPCSCTGNVPGHVNIMTNSISRDLWDATRSAIADVLAADNDRFDRGRFNAATEIGAPDLSKLVA